jgi:hypothetical protein
MSIGIHPATDQHVSFVVVEGNACVDRKESLAVLELRHVHVHHVLLVREEVHQSVVFRVVEYFLSKFHDLRYEQFQGVYFSVIHNRGFCKMVFLAIKLAKEEKVLSLVLLAVRYYLLVDKACLVILHRISGFAVYQLGNVVCNSLKIKYLVVV